MYCKECGSEIKEGSKVCDVCGYSYEEDENKSFNYGNVLTKLKNTYEKVKNNKKARVYLIGGIVIAAAMLVFLFQSNSLNKYEEQIYNGCLEIKDRLKDPDSLVLYDDAIVLEKEKDGTVYSIFEYGGSNSYGATVKSEAVVVNGEYLFDTDDELEYGDSEKAIDAKLNIAMIKFSLTTNGEATGYKEIDVDMDKIKSKLGID